MAIYHFNVKMVSRNKGQSSVFVSSRHACEKLYDARLGLLVNNLQKYNVIFKKILLPVVAPSWMSDREKLWNSVEAVEKRKDSQLAREVTFSMPKELNDEQNVELAKKFVRDEFVSCGMVADLCIHISKTKEGEKPPHAYVMLSLREVNHDGFGLKKRDWNGKGNIISWRESWAKHANRCLASNGIDQRIDHRSNAELGIDLVPQKKIGIRNLKVSEQKRDVHRMIVQENYERLLNDPRIALKAINNIQHTFTDLDLVKFISRNSVDSNQIKDLYKKIKASKHVVSVGRGKDGLEKYRVILKGR